MEVFKMKKKTGAQEHTIIIGTILASILVFVLGFFLGRVWVLMPQEKMVQSKEEHPPAIVESEEGEFEDTLAQLSEQKKLIAEEERKRQKKEKERIEEAQRDREKERKAALLKEKIRQEEERRKKEELAKKSEREKLLAQKKEEELAKKKTESKKQQEQERKRKEDAQKTLEAKKKAVNEEKVKPKEEKPEPTTPPTLDSEGEYYTIQLQSSQNKERVEKLLTELRAQGYTVYAIQADLKEKGIWYRIRLGKYNTNEEAINDAEKLKSKGTINSYWIVKR